MASFPLLELADMSRQQGLCTCCVPLEQEGNDKIAPFWKHVIANTYRQTLFPADKQPVMCASHGPENRRIRHATDAAPSFQRRKGLSTPHSWRLGPRPVR